jgi:hypothetical protein
MDLILTGLTSGEGITTAIITVTAVTAITGISQGVTATDGNEEA